MIKYSLMLKWAVEHWKPASALVYTVICLFDFVVFPSWVGITRISLEHFIQVTHDVDPALRVSMLEYAYRAYMPYTLSGAGLFHLSFGALLTGAAVTGNKTLFGDRRNPEPPVE